MEFYAHDTEKAPYTVEEISHPSSPPSSIDDEKAAYNTWYGRAFAPLRRIEERLNAKMGVESQGPYRVLPSEREKPRSWNMVFLWASATMNLSAFATGFIPIQLGLDLTQSIVVGVFGTLLGAVLTAWCATMGGSSLEEAQMVRVTGADYSCV